VTYNQSLVLQQGLIVVSLCSQVTDDIAPDYSKIISQPMWLKQVQKKINHDEYTTLAEFDKDIKLIFNNCITYNYENSDFGQVSRFALHLSNECCANSWVSL
jgi:hypothetical protein